jgi:hypothetical protein
MAFFRATPSNRGIEIEVELPVSIIQEGKTFVAYTPALDLSTCADSKNEVVKMFNEAVRIFFDDLIESNTADEVLPGLGWKKDDRRATWLPPVIQQESIGVKIPAFA